MSERLSDSIREPQVMRGAPPVTGAEIEVAIVGGGACGMTAALALARAGIESIVLERDARATGSTALSSGFVPAAGTRAQRRQGITDDRPDIFAEDVQKKARGTADPALVAAYTGTVADAVDALETHHGIEWQVLDNFLYPGHRRHRMHAVAERTGVSLMHRLSRAGESAGLIVMNDSQVTELWVDDSSRITAVGVRRPDGSIEHVGCRAVMLACNGFGGNPALLAELLPAMKTATYAGHTGNDGSAILWGRQLGAGLADLGAYQGHGSWAIPQGALLTWGLMMEGGVQVNLLGQRFHDETLGYSEAAVSVLAQPDGVAWCVFDDAVLAFAEDFPDFRDARAAGALRSADSPEALAAAIGCDPAGLAATVASIRPGTDPMTGRVFKRSWSGRLHAAKVTGALFHTQGGLLIDPCCRVLREADRQPFPNLYAAGGAARGVSGVAVWGYLSGNGLLSAIGGGHLAAQSITAQLR